MEFSPGFLKAAATSAAEVPKAKAVAVVVLKAKATSAAAAVVVPKAKAAVVVAQAIATGGTSSDGVLFGDGAPKSSIATEPPSLALTPLTQNPTTKRNYGTGIKKCEFKIADVRPGARLSAVLNCAHPN